MNTREMTVTEFMIEEQRCFPQPAHEFTVLLNAVRLACKRISFTIGRGALSARGEAQGDAQRIANEIFVRTSERGGHLAGMVSGASIEPCPIPEGHALGDYLLAFNPLDGAGNIDINAPTGSIFSILKSPGGTRPATAQDFMQSGAAQLCAGYAIYGATTLLVLTLGRGVFGFTLDRGFGEFVLTHPRMTIPAETDEFAINASHERFWEPPVKRYVSECLAGVGGMRGKDFTMRWSASLVAEVHRVLVRGGLFLDPLALHEPTPAGRLHLLYEANPMALLIQQADGAASTGRAGILMQTPTDLHERTPLLLGCRSEVERIERYYFEHDQGLDRIYSSPLFKERSLFTQT